MNRPYRPPVSTTPNAIEIDSLVILKVIKHSEQEKQLLISEGVQGYLTGLIFTSENGQKKLEVTNCFPMLKSQGDDDDEDQIAASRAHQERTLKMFRHTNIDYQLVGFYQSAPFGACFLETVVESMFAYQMTTEESIMLVYDPVKTSQGVLSVKAYRLSSEAMKLCYKDFSPESIKKSRINYQNLFEDIPITIRNSNLVNICLTEVALLGKPGATRQALELGSSATLEQCIRQTMNHTDQLKDEVNKFVKYSGTKQRYDAMRENMLQKRMLENEQRRSRGETLLPAEDETMKLPKMPMPPTMLDGLLRAADIKAHVDHTLQAAAQNLSKLFMTETIIGEKGQISKERTTSTTA